MWASACNIIGSNCHSRGGGLPNDDGFRCCCYYGCCYSLSLCCLTCVCVCMSAYIVAFGGTRICLETFNCAADVVAAVPVDVCVCAANVVVATGNVHTAVASVSSPICVVVVSIVCSSMIIIMQPRFRKALSLSLSLSLPPSHPHYTFWVCPAAG